MRYIEFKENRQHGTYDFPFAFYNVTPLTPRYHMLHHWHPEYEIVRILEGAFTIQLDGKNIQGQPGDTFLIAGGVLHSGIPHHCHYQCIVFDMDFFLNERHSCHRLVRSLSQHDKKLTDYLPSTMSTIHQILGEIFDTLSEKQNGYELIVTGLFYYFFGMAQKENLISSEQQLPVHIKKIKRFKEAISYIQDHYREPISLEQIATHAHMNPNYFCNFFREITNMTPIQYLNFYRIECACEMLVGTDLTVTTIALDCGFNDLSYFVKVFKKQVGVTPSGYAKKGATK